MRIRAIKPEFWKKQRLAKLTIGARLLFIGLWNLADDYGRFRAHPSNVKGELFPYDDDADVALWLVELAAAGRVQLYSHDGEDYGFVVNFTEHQKIDKRAATRLPTPPPVSVDYPLDRAEESAEPAQKLAEPAYKVAETTADVSPEISTKPSPAHKVAEPAEKRVEPANFTPVDQGSGIREQGTGTLARGGARDELASRGASPDRTRPEPEGSDRKSQLPDDGTSPIADLVAALMRTRYRAIVSNQIVRRGMIREAAETFLATGLTPADVDKLAGLAESKSKDDPGALLATWLDNGAWREVVDEQASKSRHRGLRQRGSSSDNGADPKAAGSVVDDALDGIYGAPRSSDVREIPQ